MQLMEEFIIRQESSALDLIQRNTFKYTIVNDTYM